MSKPLLSSKEGLVKSANRRAIDKVQSRISEKVILREHPKSPNDSNIILTCLKNHFVFYNLTENELENVKDKMLWCEVDEEEIIYQEGDETNCFFIVAKGKLEETVNSEFKKSIKQMDGFGELAMLYKTQRTSKVQTQEKCEMWVIDRELFKTAVEEVIIKDFQENRKCLENLRFFNGLERSHKDLIAASLLTKKFAKNQTIIKEGDPGSCFYYIKDGYASAYKGSKLVKKLMKGDSFGEQSLYYNTMRQLSIKADEESTFLILPRDTLFRIMGENIYQVTFKNFIQGSLENYELFESLKKDQIELILQRMKLTSFKTNETIFRKGVSGFQKLVVVIEGQLKNTRNGAIVATKGQCYGGEYMLAHKKNTAMEDEIIMNGYGVLAELSDYKIVEELNMEIINQKEGEIHSRSRIFSYKNMPDRKKLKNLELSKMFYLDQIKNGQFGHVFALKDDEGNSYAMKSLNKKLIEEYDVQDFILKEVNILQELSHPFIISSGKTFHTILNAYEIFEFVEGEDFDKVMEDIGLFSSKDGQFYTASIISILEYLNQESIICRDLKPENFMVDKEGYLKLINMSVSKKVQKEGRTVGKTYTIIGTPHYMAPDIILGKGYNNMVDIWSLGVILFEFMSGFLPFGDAADNAYEIYEEIMRNEIKFPEFMVDKRARKLIEQLLSHNPDSRLDGSFENIKSNFWFNDMNWELLESKALPESEIPYKPQKKIDLLACLKLPLLPEIKRIEKEQLARLKNMPSKPQIELDKWFEFDEYVE